MRKKIELLAPAGGITQFFAAVENGADAVYLGGYKFNARIKADNFTIKQLRDVIEYAHLRNVKVYITLNTLISDDELESAAKYCEELYSLGADGLIVQDLGLAGWVKEYFPDFPLHLSTQGTVYNLSGVKAAESLGFTRVVLARETSLSEIKNITDSCQAEIEMFVHGALCMCYSGQCQMSRVIGGINGRSGNRGLCAQPCRLPYGKNTNNNGKRTPVNDEYPLSPKDLCTIDNLGEIIDSGVTSLKIEGRMKSPEYVAIVTSIYRKYLDEYMNKGSYNVSSKDLHALRQIYSRGDFTTGYLFDNPCQDLLTEVLPKHQGIYLGKVVNVLKGKNLIDITVSDSLSLGDGIEIRNLGLSGNIITYIEKIGKQTYRIGDIKGPVKIGQEVYRTSQASLNKEAQKTYEGTAFIDGKNHKRVPINIELFLRINEHPVINIIEENKHFAYVAKDIVTEKAINKPLDNSTAERQLRKTGSTCFEAVSVSVEIENGCTLPLSALNKLRRDTLNAYSQEKINDGVREKVNEPKFIFSKRRERGKKYLAFYSFDIRKIKDYNFRSKMDLLDVKNARLYLPLQEFMDGVDLPDFLDPVPYVLNISKGNLDSYIEKNFEAVVKAVKEAGTGIAVGNLGWCREFFEAGLTVYGDYGLNVYNEKAAEVVSSMGVSPVYMSLESQNEGGWPIMITEYPMEFGELTDRKKQGYYSLEAPSGDKWMLFRPGGGMHPDSLISGWKKAHGEFRIYI